MAFETDDFDYDEYEAGVHAQIRKDEELIGDIGEPSEFNICDDCPLVGFPQEDVVGHEESTGWSVRYPGYTVSVRLMSSTGKSSDEILLGTHPSNSISGKRVAKIYDEAGKRTQECHGPRKIPPFLGPLAIKRCRALEKFKH